MVEKIETWQERLKKETLELIEKVNKLSVFLETPTYQALEEEQKVLLKAQLIGMEIYLNALKMRCELCKIDLEEKGE